MVLLSLLGALLSLTMPQFSLDRDPLCVAQALVGRLDVLLMPVSGERPSGERCPWQGERVEGVELGQASTRFFYENEGRAHNVLLAASMLDGIELPALAEFSFNETLGERTRSRGFRTAPVYVRQKVHSGVGGGVCQVSSTLYAAAVDAGMDIIERYPHSALVGYGKMGLDATVDYGRKDLRFRNPNPYPIRIHAGEGKKGSLVVRFLGPAKISRTSFKTRVVEEEPSDVVMFRLRRRIADPVEKLGKPRILLERTIRRTSLLVPGRVDTWTDYNRYKALPWVIAVHEYPDGKRMLTGVSSATLKQLLKGTKHNVKGIGTYAQGR
jgi:hypothetical protein